MKNKIISKELAMVLVAMLLLFSPATSYFVFAVVFILTESVSSDEDDNNIPLFVSLAIALIGGLLLSIGGDDN